MGRWGVTASTPSCSYRGSDAPDENGATLCAGEHMLPGGAHHQAAKWARASGARRAARTQLVQYAEVRSAAYEHRSAVASGEEHIARGREAECAEALACRRRCQRRLAVPMIDREDVERIVGASVEHHGTSARERHRIDAQACGLPQRAHILPGS